MWGGLALYFLSIFCASFATQVRLVFVLRRFTYFRHGGYLQVWQLILLQGVGFGISGGLLYVPVIKLLSEWFSERKGLAGGIIFAGGGVGGTPLCSHFKLRTLSEVPPTQVSRSRSY